MLHRLSFAALILLPLQDVDRERADAAAAERLARSVELYSRYTGEWPRTLADLTRRPEGARFWPEGGYWNGTIPEGASWKDGALVLRRARITVPPPSRRAVVPPTERLRLVYEARVRLQLLKFACEAHRRIQGKLPEKLADLGGDWKDPWGEPFELAPRNNGIRLSVKKEASRRLLLKDLTSEEIQALAEAAEPRWTDAERREIERRLDDLVDDDLETREEAVTALVRIGDAAGTFVRARLAKAKDLPRRFLEEAVRHFPERRPAWQTELAPIRTVLLADRGERADVDCANHLAQLWKMQNVYMVTYGGTRKSMPSETGTDFWLKLSKPPTVLIDDTLKEIFLCPLSTEEEGCSYRGPSGDVNQAGEGDPVGMCDGEDHGDRVVILRKSGDVQIVTIGDPLHESALKKTKR